MFATWKSWISRLLPAIASSGTTAVNPRLSSSTQVPGTPTLVDTPVTRTVSTPRSRSTGSSSVPWNGVRPCTRWDT
ncbi:MAG TPA: hypothetical protein VHC18_13850 [Amycolatopsis sp.]|nr:hypothetical protein [Amycolatopsis sp.]